MDQNKKKSLCSFLKILSFARFFPVPAAIVTAVSFYFAMKTDFDYDIGHFALGSVPFGVTVGAIIVSVLLSCALALIGRKSASFAAVPDETPVTVFGSVFASVISIASLIFTAADIARGVPTSVFAVVTAVLMPFIAVSAILSIIPSLRFSGIRQISAVIAAVAVNFSMFADYFDFTLPLNSPIRNLVTVMKCSVLIYLLSEARFSLSSKNIRATVPFFLLSSALTASVTLGYSLGAIAFAVISPAADDPNPSVISIALFAAIGVHAFGRLVSVSKYVGEYIEPPKEEKEDVKSEKNK